MSRAVQVGSTCGLLLLVAGCARPLREAPAPAPRTDWTYDHGGVIRGGIAERKLALIFTGGDYGEGTAHILAVLQKLHIHASFFVTGAYIRQTPLQPLLRQIVADGHYLGPHSDSHPLYCPWEDRERTLVTREFFEADLRRNIADLRRFGALPAGAPIYFIPPYEWFNSDQVSWARDMGIVLFNFTPGIGSNRDYAPEGHRSFVPAKAIIDGILDYEHRDPHGLSGALLLLHLGADRRDKVHLLLEPLLRELRSRGYTLVRVDELLAGATLSACAR